MIYLNNNKASIWWHQVPNAVRVLNDMSKQLLKEKSIALFFPKHVPWYDFLFETLNEKLHQSNSSNKTDILNVSNEIIQNSGDAGKFIAEKYCYKSKLNDYWPGESYAKFLAESDDIILNNTYVWIKGIDKESCRAWCDFVEEYHSNCDKSKKRAVFILEYLDDNEKTFVNYKYFQLFCWEREIKNYDYYTFCSLLVSNLNCSDDIKHYTAELAYLLGECDAEFCACLTEHGHNLAETPIETLQKYSESFRYSSDKTKIELKNLHTAKSTVLEVQIKILFPIIERYRSRFITKEYSQIQECLPMENAIGEKIEEPYEIEISGLKKLAYSNKIRIDSQKKNELKFFYDSRNKLAHNNIVSYQEVKRILTNGY